MAKTPPDTQDRVRRYFRVKTRQLSALADLPICDHSGLIGSHREEFQRIYLRDILPKRFGVGRGMVYGAVHRSREADIVIWDEGNHPKLPMLDHSFFFAESVRLVLEAKSTWSMEEFTDVLAKCRAVRDIITLSGPNLTDTLAGLQQEIAALKMERDHAGMIIVPQHRYGSRFPKRRPNR